jgi:anti-sigma factor (TIGR02949 family)
MEVLARLEDFLDRELTDEEMHMVRRHLAACEDCASEYAFESRLLEELRERLSRLAVPADLVRRVTTAIAQERGEEGRGGSAG